MVILHVNSYFHVAVLTVTECLCCCTFPPPQCWFRSYYSGLIVTARKSSSKCFCQKKEMKWASQQKIPLVKHHLLTTMALLRELVFGQVAHKNQLGFVAGNPYARHGLLVVTAVVLKWANRKKTKATSDTYKLYLLNNAWRIQIGYRRGNGGGCFFNGQPDG